MGDFEVNTDKRGVLQNNSTEAIGIDDQNRAVETRRSTKLQISDRVICQSELHGLSLFAGGGQSCTATSGILCPGAESCQCKREFVVWAILCDRPLRGRTHRSAPTWQTNSN